MLGHTSGITVSHTKTLLVQVVVDIYFGIIAHDTIIASFLLFAFSAFALFGAF